MAEDDNTAEIAAALVGIQSALLQNAEPSNDPLTGALDRHSHALLLHAQRMGEHTEAMQRMCDLAVQEGYFGPQGMA